MEDVLALRRELAVKNEEIKYLKQKLYEKEREQRQPDYFEDMGEFETVPGIKHSERLDNRSISRYSRQLILPEIGVTGQLALKNSSVLIVGAGGLGCPAAIYLAAAGIGRIGIVDYDDVEQSNLHRQILHTEGRVGNSKAQSVAMSCTQINSAVVCIPYRTSLTSENAMEIVKTYDIVLDATDNVASRYLLNDLCVLTGKPLVSGSALRFEGQLTVYNYKGGPCYRCLYPKPPPPEMVTNCSDGGVIGAVPGVIGVLQALEAIKIATGAGDPMSQRLLMFDGLDGIFRTVKLRPRQDKCCICGLDPIITKLIDYEQFCGARASDKDRDLDLLTEEDRISPKDYKELLDQQTSHILIDVRTPVEMNICALPKPETTNIPISNIKSSGAMKDLQEKITALHQTNAVLPVYVVCRRGNDSQIAVQTLRNELKDLPVTIKDIRGGLTAWAKKVDPDFPVY